MPKYSTTARWPRKSATLKNDVAALRARAGISPTLAVLRIGDDDASAGYARHPKDMRRRRRRLREVDMFFAAQQGEVEEVLNELNTASEVHGIMILEPVPDHISHAALIDMLNPAGGRGRRAPHQRRAPASGTARPTSCQLHIAGGIRLLEKPASPSGQGSGHRRAQRHRGQTHGHAAAPPPLHGHPLPQPYRSICPQSAAAPTSSAWPSARRNGQARLGQARPAIVVDFGTTYTDDGLRATATRRAWQVAGMLTPVPGGTGPVTNVMLMENLLPPQAASA